jgi:hypothetical protein
VKIVAWPKDFTHVRGPVDDADAGLAVFAILLGCRSQHPADVRVDVLPSRWLLSSTAS